MELTCILKCKNLNKLSPIKSNTETKHQNKHIDTSKTPLTQIRNQIQTPCVHKGLPALAGRDSGSLSHKGLEGKTEGPYTTADKLVLKFGNVVWD